MKKILLITSMMFAFWAADAQDYQKAIGARISNDFGVSFKYFLKENHAIEVMGTFRTFGSLGYNWSYFRIGGLYQVHKAIPGVEVDGLRWYYGGGATASIYTGEYANFTTSSNVGIGLHGVVGMDYKFADIPLNLSLDWMPGFVIGSYYDGFTPGYGGLAGRYTF